LTRVHDASARTAFKSDEPKWLEARLSGERPQTKGRPVASGGEKDVKVLATSDIYLDFIRPTALRVSRARARCVSIRRKRIDRPAKRAVADAANE